MNPTDRRVRRTKKLLKESLAQLLLEKDLHTISVRELTDLADISRGAFYTHYQDIYQLYEQIEDDFFREMSNIVVTDPSHEYTEICEALIDYIYDNASICRIFMSNTLGGEFRNKMSDFMEEKYHAIVLYEMNSSELKEDWRYMTRYHMSGFIAMLSLWLESDLTYPKEQLLKVLLNIDEACDPLYV